MHNLIKLGMKIDHSCTVACSGGVDSMAILSFLSRRKTKPKVAYMNHGTGHGAQAEDFVKGYCNANGLELVVGSASRERSKEESPEEYWRNIRYEFLHSLEGQVVSGHHLDDCVGQWLFSSIHGRPGVMPVANKNVVRPFMLTEKEAFRTWCVRHSVPWIEDESNQDEKYMRNFIRQNLLPQALKVNPGLQKTVSKIVKLAYDKHNS